MMRRILGPLKRSLPRLVCFVRGLLLTRFINGGNRKGRVVLTDPFLPVRIRVGRGAKFILKGKLTLGSFLGGRDCIWISLAENSNLEIDGDFDVGSGCRIVLTAGARLYIGGKRMESGSGITERVMIMVRKHVRIGTDLICAWGCFITDCDWHENVGRPFQEDTCIGDHVWIAGNCSILKGSRIGNGCIVATGSIVHRAVLPDNSLGGGVPFRVLDSNREWHREMPTS